jgi:hypothetical protein
VLVRSPVVVASLGSETETQEIREYRDIEGTLVFSPSSFSESASSVTGTVTDGRVRNPWPLRALGCLLTLVLTLPLSLELSSPPPILSQQGEHTGATFSDEAAEREEVIHDPATGHHANPVRHPTDRSAIPAHPHGDAENSVTYSGH